MKPWSRAIVFACVVLALSPSAGAQVPSVHAAPVRRVVIGDVGVASLVVAISTALLAAVCMTSENGGRPCASTAGGVSTAFTVASVPLFVLGAYQRAGWPRALRASVSSRGATLGGSF